LFKLGTETHEKKLQISFKKLRQIPGESPSEEVQESFIAEYKDLYKQAENKEIHLLFNDPTHKIHNTIISKCWQLKGGRNTQTIQSNSGRTRFTILGAINVLDLTFTSVITKNNCDKEMASLHLEEIRKDYPDGKKIVLILDNAKYHHAITFKETAKKLNIELKFLPTYSPNLNLIERLWKFMKKIMRNTYFPTLKDFEKAIFDFCTNLDIYYNEIKKIISQKFEILKSV
jgi:transposase